MKYKVSLNKNMPELKGGLSFRSSDGNYFSYGLPVHWVKPNEPVYTNDIPSSIMKDNRVIIEEVDVVKEVKEKIKKV